VAGNVQLLLMLRMWTKLFKYKLEVPLDFDFAVLGKVPSWGSGLPDGIYFNPEIPIWYHFGRPWNWKDWYVLWSFGIYYGSLVYVYLLVTIWYIYHHFGTVYQEKSGNPCWESAKRRENFIN
jgi:hypothetical protein